MLRNRLWWAGRHLLHPTRHAEKPDPRQTRRPVPRAHESAPARITLIKIYHSMRKLEAKGANCERACLRSLNSTLRLLALPQPLLAALAGPVPFRVVAALPLPKRWFYQVALVDLGVKSGATASPTSQWEQMAATQEVPLLVQ